METEFEVGKTYVDGTGEMVEITEIQTDGTVGMTGIRLGTTVHFTLAGKPSRGAVFLRSITPDSVIENEPKEQPNHSFFPEQIKKMMEGVTFKPYAQHLKGTDTLIVYFGNKADFTKKVSEDIDLCVSMDNHDEIVGCYVHGVSELIAKESTPEPQDTNIRTGSLDEAKAAEIHRVSLRVQIYERLHQINKALGELYQLVGTADWKDDE